MSKDSCEKPARETVLHYKNGIERMLSALGVEVDFVLYDSPIRLFSVSWGGREQHASNFWVSKVIVTLPGEKPISIRPFRKGMKEIPEESLLWQEAYHIQKKFIVSLEKRKVTQTKEIRIGNFGISYLIGRNN